MIALGDKNHEYVRTQLENYNQEVILEKNWLYWLDMLNGFSCKNLDFSMFPPSLLLHGAQDAVVDCRQSYEFEKSIPQAKHIIIENAGHAPHWHDMSSVRRYIEEYIYV